MKSNENSTLRFFEKISKIPRKSGDEERISKFLVDFAKEKKLDYNIDGYNNVIIKKQGQNGGEKSETIILQAHVDMVYVKTNNSNHEYGEPLNIVYNDGIIKALGTSLGADNGIGVSYILSILNSEELKHPPIEALFTTGEEDGLLGAAQVKKGVLTGKKLINLDGEDEKILLAGSAGGIDIINAIEVNRESANSKLISYRIEVNGLKGGHSGLEINSGRANAIKLLARILYSFIDESTFYLESIDGGERPNAIPCNCEAIIYVEEKNKDIIMDVINKMRKNFIREYMNIDENIKIKIERNKQKKQNIINFNDTKKIIYALMIMPNGVQKMSPNLEAQVQTSINLAQVKSSNNIIEITSNARSSIESEKFEVCYMIEALTKIINSNFSTKSNYPSWEYEKNSPLREVFIEEYINVFGEKPSIEIIHGGLEGGYLKEKYPEMDIVSIGPNIKEVHTTSEWTEIKSINSIWDLIIKVLNRLS